MQGRRTRHSLMFDQSIRCVLLPLLLLGAVFSTVSGCTTAGGVKPSNTDRQMELVITDLVGALVQISTFNPVTTTVKFAKPDTRFGTLLLRALEEAGYGIQFSEQVEATGFVSYALRSSETDAGQVNDYLISIDDVEVRREYNTTDTGIYPASLMYVKGASKDDEIILDTNIFAEQGGDQSFLSGIETGQLNGSEPGVVSEVVADSNSRKSIERRTDMATSLQSARARFLSSEREKESANLAGLKRYKKLVLIFSDLNTLEMGVGNKLAIHQLVQDLQPHDIFEITACHDIDGENKKSELRAARIKEELMTHGIESSAIVRAPCIRTNFRHQSDDSPIPATIVHYRKS